MKKKQSKKNRKSSVSSKKQQQTQGKPAATASAGMAYADQSDANGPGLTERPQLSPDAHTNEAGDRNQFVQVVGIGASAGGLEPIEKFFDNLPANPQVAVVVVQHLAPDFRSMMDQLISRRTDMEIIHAGDKMSIRPNAVYLNPPRTKLTIQNGMLFTKHYDRMDALDLPIDDFFNSLAMDQETNAIGIIMSGTGSDGCRGGLSIREAGGVLIAQEPTSAKFEAMPRAAIENGAAVYTAQPNMMPELVLKLVAGEAIPSENPDFNFDVNPEHRILALLEKQHGADFRYYKKTTVGRRIRRRAILNQLHSLDDYEELLRSNADELEELYCDLLIGVTAFFRDQEAFKEIENLVLPEIAPLMSEDRQLRIWAPGCASGEEAYSLTILISEYARRNDLPINLKIFATDIHDRSLATSKSGTYPASGLQHVPEEIVETYFNRVGDFHQIKRAARECVVFSKHNLLRDPPFTRIDFVICRNLLIYFDDIAQERALALFHFSLVKGGHLFLGPSETTGKISKEFETLSKRWRVYKKIRQVKLSALQTALPHSDLPEATSYDVQKLRENRSIASPLSAAVIERKTLNYVYDLLLDEYAPASLLVDRQGDLLHVFGDADRFLSIRKGEFNRRITDLVHPELKLILSAGLERTFAHGSQGFQRNVKIDSDLETEATVIMQIAKMKPDGLNSDYALVTLHEKAMPHNVESVLTEGPDIDKDFFIQRTRELERDLEATEQSLQSSVEELETSNEELQATNEELMSSNEELQSTNEELHAVNEELYTVSAEHQRKILELTELTDDMNNLLKASDIGTIFLDSELNVRRFTPAAERTFNLIATDVGRPFAHVTFRFTQPELFNKIKRVFRDGSTWEEKVQVDDRRYLLRLLPYHNDHGERSGVVITIVDIEDLDRIERELTEQQALYSAVVNQQQDLVSRFTTDLKFTFVNDAYCNHYGKTREELIGSSILDVAPAEEHESSRRTLAQLKPGERHVYTRRDVNKTGVQGWIEFHRFAYGDTMTGEVAEFQAVGRDITDVKRARDSLKAVNQRLEIEEQRIRNIYKNTPIMMHSIDSNGVIIDASEYWLNVLGYRPEEVIGRQSTEFLTDESRKYASDIVLPNFWKTGSCRDVSYQMVRKDGRIIDVLLSAIVDQTEDSDNKRSLAAVNDITKILRTEKTLATKNRELARINENLNQFTQIVSHDLTGPLRGIKHTMSWIEEDSDEDARRGIQEHINRLKEQVENLQSLLNDLLEYSRAGDSSQAAEPIDVRLELEDVFDILDHPDEMTLEVTPKDVQVHALRAPMLLIFRNLIENAIKYRDKDDGTISVRVRDEEDIWIIDFSDDGPGIRKEHHAKVVLPFRKLERKDVVQGNGMGLALVKKAVEANGGDLTIASDPDVRRGTNVVIVWPKKRPQDMALESFKLENVDQDNDQEA